MNRGVSTLGRCATRYTAIYFSFSSFYLAVFGVCIFFHYGFADDYYALYLKGIGRSNGDIGTMVGGGRPFYALLSDLAFNSVKDVADLAWLRAVGIMGIAAVVMITHRFIRREKLPNGFGIPVALLVGLMPGFQVCLGQRGFLSMGGRVGHRGILAG